MDKELYFKHRYSILTKLDKIIYLINDIYVRNNIYKNDLYTCLSIYCKNLGGVYLSSIDNMDDYIYYIKTMLKSLLEVADYNILDTSNIIEDTFSVIEQSFFEDLVCELTDILLILDTDMKYNTLEDVIDTSQYNLKYIDYILMHFQVLSRLLLDYMNEFETSTEPKENKVYTIEEGYDL